MPELPEVETWRRLADATAVGRRILRADCAEDRIVLDQIPPKELAEKLQGRRIDGTGRRGKHMWLSLEDAGFLYIHFGMSGSLWHLLPEDEAPGHAKITLHLDDGSRLLYRNPRRIGKLRWHEDIYAAPAIAALGPDPLLESLSAAHLREAFHQSRRPVKSTLLDQSLFAGVGNWIADELLYQCKLNPHTPCGDLDAAAIRRLLKKLREILELAVSVGADDSRFPDTWLFHHRWGKTAKRTGRGEPIRFDTIGGRTCAWVPSRQKAQRTPSVN